MCRYLEIFGWNVKQKVVQCVIRILHFFNDVITN